MEGRPKAINVMLMLIILAAFLFTNLTRRDETNTSITF